MSSPQLPQSQLRCAVVCASNMNRSMEAHRVFAAGGMDVCSYGVGQHVKLPGAARDCPNVYPFGTPYRAIYEDLKGKDAELCAPNSAARAAAVAHSPPRHSQLPAERLDSHVGAQHDAEGGA